MKDDIHQTASRRPQNTPATLPHNSPHASLDKAETGGTCAIWDEVKKYSYHFVGVGGIGMSALAQVLREQGHTVPA